MSKKIKFSFRASKEEELGNSLNEALKNSIGENLTEEELFSKADFDEEAVERIGYSNYSYWRCTFRAFLKRKFAMFLVALMVVIIGFCNPEPGPDWSSCPYSAGYW